MAVWFIKEWDGIEVKAEHNLPGHLSVQEIETTLQRLVCRDLTVAEILLASRRTNDPLRTGFLDRVGNGHPIDYGHSNLHYTAELKED
jgi:hypothetical protein